MAKYSKGAGKEVKDALHDMKEGKLESGSGKKVTTRKQAIAIALSEAREKGEKVPAKKGASKAGGKTKAAAKSSGRAGGSNRSASGKGGSKTAKKTSVPSKKGK